MRQVAITLAVLLLTVSASGCLGNNDELEQRVAELEGENDALELRVAELEGEVEDIKSGNTAINLAPICWIDALLDDSSHYEGDDIYFDATAYDIDGIIWEYQWRSQIDGVISSQEDFVYSNLSLGNHTVTLVITDNAGSTATCNISLRIEVVVVGSPFAQFTSTMSSNGEYYITVLQVSSNHNLTAFSYFLKDASGSTNEFGEIAMQNLSGNVVGIDASYGFKCGGSEQPTCEDDLTTRSDAVGSDSGSNYAVAFYDNDRDGKLSSGDKFTVRGNHGSGANGPAEDDWSLEIKFDSTGDVIGSKWLG